MHKAILPLILLTGFSAYPQELNCKCRSPQPPPIYGKDSNKAYVYKRMRGQVGTLGNPPQPIENLTIEVYDHPEVVAQPSTNSKATQRLIASCKTDEHGMFCFDGIRPGKYEIRISDRESHRATGPWEDVTLVVTVNPKKRQSTNKLIRIFLQFRI